MKKKTSSSWLRLRVISLLILVGSTIVVAGFVVFCVFIARGLVIGKYRINQMQFWQLPSESEFVSFETQMFGGSATFLQGRITINSRRTLAEIQDFYETHYGIKCMGMDTVTVASEVNLSENHTRYKICNIIQIDGY